MGRSRQLATLFGGAHYYKKVVRTGPIAVWPQWEDSGSVSHELILGSQQDGAYIGVTLGQVVTDANGITFTCPLFDGENDYNNIYTTTFRDRFDPTKGMAMVWLRVYDSEVWADENLRRGFFLAADGNNFVAIYKSSADNILTFLYRAGGTIKQRDISLSDTNWFCAVITWSKLGDEVRAFLNGTQQGATLTTLGTWDGNLASGNTVIGASSITPTNPWHGWNALFAMWDRVDLTIIPNLYNWAL